MELTRLQSSPANHQLTSTSKRLNVRGFPPGILLQLRVAVATGPGELHGLTDAVDAVDGSCRRAAGRSWR